MLMKYIPEVVSPVVPSSPSTWSLSPPGVAGLLCPSLPIVCIIYEHTECVCVEGGHALHTRIINVLISHS